MDTEPIQRWQKFLATVLGTAVATICFDVPVKRAAAQINWSLLNQALLLNQEEVLTTSGALVCASPYNKWLKSLGCVEAKTGIRAKLIERIDFPGIGYIWKVRLRPEDGEGVTVWGRPYSFVSLRGEWLDLLGFPQQRRTPDPVPRPPVQTVIDPPVKGDTWFLQGSSMRLTEDGKRRILAYENPKTTMLRFGVRKGTVFFVGEQEGRSYRGTAHAFYQGCAPLPYQVEGEISENNRHLSLKGKLPQVDGSCNVQSYKDDIIELKQHEATAIIR